MPLNIQVKQNARIWESLVYYASNANNQTDCLSIKTVSANSKSSVETLRREVRSVFLERVENKKRDDVIPRRFLAFLVHKDYIEGKDFIEFLSQKRLGNEKFPTLWPNLVEEVMGEEGRVWTSRFVNYSSIWVFKDYQDSNATHISISLELKNQPKTKRLRLRAWGKKKVNNNQGKTWVGRSETVKN